MHDQDGRLWLFVMFGLGAAMRHREILKVRYDQIDFASRRIFIPEAKAGEREQPITPALADALKRQQAMEDEKKTGGWVFPTLIPGQAKACHRTNMARPFGRAVLRAKLDPDKVTPHTMRHTAITRLVKACVDLPTIQKISGHKTSRWCSGTSTSTASTSTPRSVRSTTVFLTQLHRNYTRLPFRISRRRGGWLLFLPESQQLRDWR